MLKWENSVCLPYICFHIYIFVGQLKSKSHDCTKVKSYTNFANNNKQKLCLCFAAYFLNNTFFKCKKKGGGGEDRAAWMAMKSLYLLIWQLFCQTWKMTNITKCLSEGTWCLHSVAFTHCSVLGGDTQGLHQEGHPAWKYAITCGSSSWIKKQPKVFMTFFPLSLQNFKKHNKKTFLWKEQSIGTVIANKLNSP